MWSKRLRLCVFAVLLCLSVSGTEKIYGAALEISPEERECRRNLAILHDALHEFKNSQGVFPDSLAALVPRILSAKYLICPSAAKSEGFQPSTIDPNSRTPQQTYNYEFSRKTHQASSHLGDYTHRDAKQAQRIVLGWNDAGKRVPIVRCKHHKRYLNLPVIANGRSAIYRSGLYWECEFVDQVPGFYLLGSRALADSRPISERVQPFTGFGFSESDDFYPIPLDTYYNALLRPFWAAFGQPSLDLSLYFPRGFIQAGDVPFDVRGLIQLEGKMCAWTERGEFFRAFPTKKTGVEIGKRVNVLHILHGCISFDSQNKKSEPRSVASYTIHFSDPKEPSIQIPLMMKREIRHWKSSNSIDSTRSDSTMIVSLATSDQRGDSIGGEEMVLDRLSWRNPKPDSEIRSVDVAANRDFPAVLLLFGITLE